MPFEEHIKFIEKRNIFNFRKEKIRLNAKDLKILFMQLIQQLIPFCIEHNKIPSIPDKENFSFPTHIEQGEHQKRILGSEKGIHIKIYYERDEHIFMFDTDDSFYEISLVNFMPPLTKEIFNFSYIEQDDMWSDYSYLVLECSNKKLLIDVLKNLHAL